MDTTVQSTQTTYDTLGRAEMITSYSDNACTTAVNEVVYEYDDFGALAKEYQEHEGAKDGSTLSVAYAYDMTVSGGEYTKAYRLKSVTYPNGRLVHYTYGSSGSRAEVLSRLDAIQDNSGGDPGDTLAAYSWNGAGRMVVEDFQQPDV